MTSKHEHGLTIEGLDHVAIQTAQLEATIEFYDKILGLKPGHRADFKFPGAWLYAGGRDLRPPNWIIFG